MTMIGIARAAVLLAGGVALAAAAMIPGPDPTRSRPVAARSIADPGTDPLETAFDRAFAPGGKFRYTGAVVTVVRDGHVVFSKGYGHEDSAGHVPVDPEQTRFRLGSITKTLVAVGIGKLIDSGRVTSLDTPVNRYLTGMKVPANGGREITLRMLGTHQAGLAEARQPFQRAGEPKVTVDDAYLADHFPGYVVPVDSGSNYSNYGAALLGQVIADQTGQSFSQFVEKQVFQPLGMNRALILGDPSPRPRVAQADAFYPNGGKRRIPDIWSNNPGNIAAGALGATGADMGRYMIGLLGGGGTVPSVLSLRARAVVFTRQGGTHPLTQGYGVLFMINRWNGETIIEHGGRTLGASSYMSLLPDRRTGIFVATTGDFGQALPLAGLLGLPPAPAPDKAQAGKALAGLAQLRAIGLEALLGRYRLPIKPGADLPFEASEYAGPYVGQRRAIRSVTQIFTDTFLGGPLTVTPGAKGELLLGRTPYRQVARDVFWHDPALTPDRPSGWNDLLVFRRDAAGRVKDASLLYTDVVFTRATGVLTPAHVNRALLWGVLILLTGLLSFLWVKRARGRIVAPVAAAAILASPMLFFRSWPAAAVESLSYVWIRPGNLAIFQLWLDAIAVLAGILIVFAAMGIVRRDPATGWRAALARWHLRMLAVGAMLTLVAFGWYGMLGWNVG